MRLLLILIVGLSFLSGCITSEPQVTGQETPTASASTLPSPAINLPEPRLSGNTSLEETLARRRSIREYSQTPLKQEEVSQLLWAAQGITSASGGRTVPSAGALYPLEVYLIAGNVENLSPGIYKYQPQGHKLIWLRGQDVRGELCAAALGQAPVKNGAIDMVIAAVYERTTQRYGERGIRFTHIEAGHAAQNIVLQATALSLGAVPIGAFDDNRVEDILTLPENESPLYIIPVGNKI
jgi:SagB-type dehydrogenase family enzyme